MSDVVMLDISDLGPVERMIVMVSVQRLREGLPIYGQWNQATKNNVREAFHEAIDLTHYLAAEIIKQDAIGTPATSS